MVSAETAVLGDLENDRWTSVTRPLNQSSPRTGGSEVLVQAVVADDTGFWLGSNVGLHRIEADSNTIESWWSMPAFKELPADHGLSHLVGSVHLIADDGVHLWINTRAKRENNSTLSLLYVLHKETRRWVGCMLDPSADWMHATAASETYFWVGAGNAHSGGKSLFRVECKQVSNVREEVRVPMVVPTLAELP